MSCTARGKLRLPNQLPSPAQLAQIPVGIYCLDPRSTCALRQVKGAINRTICCQLGWSFNSHHRRLLPTECFGLPNRSIPGYRTEPSPLSNQPSGGCQKEVAPFAHRTEQALRL